MTSYTRDNMQNQHFKQRPVIRNASHVLHNRYHFNMAVKN